MTDSTNGLAHPALLQPLVNRLGRPRSRRPDAQTSLPFFVIFSRASVVGSIGPAGTRPTACSSSRNWASSSLVFGPRPRAAVNRSIIVCACASRQLFVLLEVSLMSVCLSDPAGRVVRSPAQTAYGTRLKAALTGALHVCRLPAIPPWSCGSRDPRGPSSSSNACRCRAGLKRSVSRVW